MVYVREDSVMRIARSFVPLLLAAALLFVVAKLHFPGWIAITIASSVALAVPMIIAYRMRTSIAFAVLAVMLADLIIEFFAHLAWGIQSVQGGATHWAIFGASAIGVLFGVMAKKAGANAGPDADAV
jgi:Na+/alanine symporter